MKALHYHDPLMNEIWDEQARRHFTLSFGFWPKYFNYKVSRVPRSALRRLKRRMFRKG
jgi:hypothetical protein